MNNLFTTLRSFFLLIILSITLGVGYATFSLREINFEARGFINITMLGLFADWNESDFLMHISHELRKNMTDRQLQQMNGVFARLGKLLNYHGAYGGLFRSRKNWWYINPHYKVHASFQGGYFAATITLIKQQGKWAIGRIEYQYRFFPNKRDSASLKLASLSGGQI
jgi:hypothetical protein